MSINISGLVRDSIQVLVFFIIGFGGYAIYKYSIYIPTNSVVTGDFSKYRGNISTDKLIIYTTKTCSVCIKLKAFLHLNNIQYVEKDVKIEKYKNEVREMGSNSVPTILMNENLIVGFDKESIIKYTTN